MNEQIGEKCGVFGIFGNNLDVARLTFFGLYALQHRGQESSGIATTNGKDILSYKNIGLVSQVFNESVIKALGSNTSFAAIGHNRYSTSGGVGNYYTQPVISNNNAICDMVIDRDDPILKHSVSLFKDDKDFKNIALVHNGNIPSLIELEKFLIDNGIDMNRLSLDPCLAKNISNDESFKPSDSIMILEAIMVYTRKGLSIEEAIEKVFPLLVGAFSILIMTDSKLIAIRDEYGIRPLSIGTMNESFVIASETCAFHPIGAEFLRDVLPGEMVVIDQNGLSSRQLAKGNQKLDIFEFVYFARPDSELLGQSVYDVRKRFGEQLADEYPINADVVIPIPETSIPVAISLSRSLNIPFEMGLVKSRYIHRTFIKPEQHTRDQGVKLKLSPLVHIIKDKKVIIVDDSLVRGTTSKQIIKMLFDAGAKEVHFMLSSPPVKYPDFYGIDLPNQKELFACSRSVEDMRMELGATSLNFLSFDGMIKATQIPKESFCTSCFTGEYPIDLKEKKEGIIYEK